MGVICDSTHNTNLHHVACEQAEAEYLGSDDQNQCKNVKEAINSHNNAIKRQKRTAACCCGLVCVQIQYNAHNIIYMYLRLVCANIQYRGVIEACLHVINGTYDGVCVRMHVRVGIVRRAAAIPLVLSSSIISPLQIQNLI